MRGQEPDTPKSDMTRPDFRWSGLGMLRLGPTQPMSTSVRKICQNFGYEPGKDPIERLKPSMTKALNRVVICILQQASELLTIFPLDINFVFNSLIQ